MGKKKGSNEIKTEAGKPQPPSSRCDARAAAPRRVNNVYTAGEILLLQLGGRVGGCIKVGWVGGEEKKKEGAANAKLMPFPDITESAEIPLFRVDKRTRVLLYLSERARGNGGRRVLKGVCVKDQ